MAYFIVIGTDSSMQNVVDEIKKSHLQRNVITSGCLRRKGEDLFYNWDTYNAKGEIVNKNSDGSVNLRDAITNQIAQFKTLLPNNKNQRVNVFVIAKCFTEEQCSDTNMVCEVIWETRGNTISGLDVDVVMVGYEPEKSGVVTLRPSWKTLKKVSKLMYNGQFNTKVLYLNNMDYMGAATNIDNRLLGKFLCHWSKMVTLTNNPKTAINQNNIYSIGMAEYQYDYADVEPYLMSAIEERVWNRMVNATPAEAVVKMLETNFCKKIDLDRIWLDGVKKIWKQWKPYCKPEEYNYGLQLEKQPYNVDKQKKQLLVFFNGLLKIFCSAKNTECDRLIAENKQLADNIMKMKEAAEHLENKIEDADEVEDLYKKLEELRKTISDEEKQITEKENKINLLRDVIDSNSFIDANDIFNLYNPDNILTDEDKSKFEQAKISELSLFDYLRKDSAMSVIKEVISLPEGQQFIEENFPKNVVDNIGRLHLEEGEANEPAAENILSDSSETQETSDTGKGCLPAWVAKLLGKNKVSSDSVISSTPEPVPVSEPLTPAKKTGTDVPVPKMINAAKQALLDADNMVGSWWNKLDSLLNELEKKIEECVLYRNNYKINSEHKKSHSLVDVERIRKYVDNDEWLMDLYKYFEKEWFNPDWEEDKRPSLTDFIRTLITNPIEQKYNVLKWDGNNPFVNEQLTDQKISEIIAETTDQSKPFVEYVQINTDLQQNINSQFYFNNEEIETDINTFYKKYNVGQGTLIPICEPEFINSLCIVQVLPIVNHIDELRDFKPRREAVLHDSQHDYSNILRGLNLKYDSTPQSKALAIYNWICDNIQYDTTKQIHDADRCYGIRRGVCQAYCELFCHLAEAIGLTVEIISGICKMPGGEIPVEKHSWLFVYTNGYGGMLIDPTWGAGSVQDGNFIKNTVEERNKWYNVDPACMVFSHYPDDEEWLNTDIKVSEEQFRKLPYLNPDENTGSEALAELSRLISLM